MQALSTRKTLHKSERLRLKLEIEALFEQGESFVSYPLRIVYRLQKTPRPARASVLIVVGKKYFKRANKRNHIKRLIREAYRQHKHTWLQTLEQQEVYATFALLSIAKETSTYAQVERATIKALDKLVDRLHLGSQD